MSASPGASSASGSLKIRLRLPTPSSVSSSSIKRVSIKQPFYIQPPILPSAEKKKYEHGSDQFSLPTGMDIKLLDEIIGEYSVGRKLYYFARYQSGIAYKIPEAVCLEELPTLVEEYDENKASNNLPYEHFDPSAAYIHPQSRVTSKGDSPREHANQKSRHGERDSEKSEEEAEEEEEEDKEVDNYSTSDAGSPPIRTTRSGGRKRALPFSPKKTRSRARTTSTDAASEYSDSPASARPTRRSTRARITRLAQDDDSFNEDDDVSERSVPKRTVKRKAARPEYGRLRQVGDLDDEEITSLQAHYDTCSKCHQKRADLLLKKKGKKRKTEEGEMEPHELGGWVRCLRCPIVAHWSCLSKTQQDEVLKAVRTKENGEWERENEASEMPVPKPPKRVDVETDETTEFVCASCSKGGDCFVCLKAAVAPLPTAPPAVIAHKTPEDDVEMIDGTRPALPAQGSDDSPQGSLLFRCLRCNRLAHYDHLPQPYSGSDLDTQALASYYQSDHEWRCMNCIKYNLKIDTILAWRPFPAGAIERTVPYNYKSPLPREYLVKWSGRSYRRVEWIPHAWLLAVHGSKLKNFLSSQSKDVFLTSEEGRVTDAEDGTMGQSGSRATSAKGDESYLMPHTACVDAESKIPTLWKTVDRVLDVLFWRSPKQQKSKANTKRLRVDSEDEQEKEEKEEADEALLAERAATYDEGEQPSDTMTEDLVRRQKRIGKMIVDEDVDELSTQVAWVFVKWKDLGYEQATWDSPPRVGEPGFEEFQLALAKFTASQSVTVPKKSRQEYEAFDKRAENAYKKKYYLKSSDDLKLGQDTDLKLMPFQVEGFNWLCDNWWRHQHCILADEMGLGKTVQIAAFLGKIVGKFRAYPALVVVPNSTITNWVRELERWAPELRVVPFYGEKASRAVIKQFELTHNHVVANTTGAKFHVLVTTYETITSTDDFTSVFKKQPRWEVLVVDEGQRLKNDSSMIFRKLNELHTAHRIILTGTPLNNNIRELFNLMNFLDPVEWKDLEALEKDHEELTEELIKQLHNRLRPYFLRRVKSEVLQLPPKNEVIVPISMAPLQKEVYKSILSKNVEILRSLTQPAKNKNTASLAKSKMNNLLMQLRKCLQHPYLYEEDIEPKGLTSTEAHEKLVNASGKLRFLKTLLSKLKARGHRVLLFSQFVIALDVIEDFLVGEGIKFLRLDGNTKQAQRQKDMDTFNAPGSDIFIYLLTTRAGGVGINLWTADTVIIFDPDFNPHQDLQAIARAHRYGQKRTCLVFKLMVKESAEERIMQVGKKKLVLDHLIVQKMDDEDGPGQNVQSILTYGAKALFESENAKDITYTDHDVDILIEKTEKEGDEPEAAKDGPAFSFAKVWSADKDSLDEIEEEAPEEVDSWAQTLQRLAEERQKAIVEEVTGRGTKRRAAQAKPTQQDIPEFDEVGVTPKRKGKTAKPSANDSDIDNDSDYGPARSVSSISSAGSSSLPAGDDIQALRENSPVTSKTSKFIPQMLGSPSSDLKSVKSIPQHIRTRINPDYCGLCDTNHGSKLGDCPMTKKSEHLADYRQMLLTHGANESIDQRRSAVNAIDEVLSKRGHQHVIVGQPLYLVEQAPKAAVQRQVKQPTVGRPKPRPIVKPRVPDPVLPVTVSSSKRPTSPISGPITKKSRSSSAAACPVCNTSPFHLVKDCPTVKAGPESIRAAIRRLEAKPEAYRDLNLMTVLNKLLKRSDSQGNKA